MFSSPLLSPQRDELSLPATSKALLTSLLISIISTYRSDIRRPFDGTIRRLYIGHTFLPYGRHRVTSDLYSAGLTFARCAGGPTRDQMDCPWIQIIIGASLSEPLLDELAGAFLWYIYIYICIHGQSIWSRVVPP